MKFWLAVLFLIFSILIYSDSACGYYAKGNIYVDFKYVVAIEYISGRSLSGEWAYWEIRFPQKTGKYRFRVDVEKHPTFYKEFILWKKAQKKKKNENRSN